jgi:DNA repair exonuclease SbcCD nuclease subunit
VTHSIPFFLVLGNHEGEQGWRGANQADSLDLWGAVARKIHLFRRGAAHGLDGLQNLLLIIERFSHIRYLLSLKKVFIPFFIMAILTI